MEKDVKMYLEFDKMLDFDDLVLRLFEVITENFDYVYPAIFLLDENKKSLHVVKDQTNPKVHKILEKILGVKMEDLEFGVTLKGNNIIDAFNNKRLKESKSVKNLAVPYGNDLMYGLIDRLLNLKSYCSIPMIVNNHSVGVVVFGLRKRKKLSENEVELLMSFFSEIGGYLVTNWKIKKLKDQQDKLNKLLNIKKEFLFNINEILDGVLESNSADEDFKEKVKEVSQYLNSLVLLSEIVEQDKYE